MVIPTMAKAALPWNRRWLFITRLDIITGAPTRITLMYWTA